MSRRQFDQLIEGFCRLCGLDHPDRIQRGTPVKVNEVVFSLIHSDRVDPDLIFMYADFGPLPAQREAAVSRALLQANLNLHSPNRPSLAISPDTGYVLLADHLRLERATPQNLRAALIDMSLKAREWRQTYFLAAPSGLMRSHRRLPAP